VIYIDTGPFLARFIARDQYHRRAAAAWKKLGERRESCFTSNLVFNETFTLLARRTRYDFAAGRARLLLSSKALTILRSTGEDEFDAVELFRKFADQGVSFTDCVSFVLMRKQRLTRAFSFDRHYEQAGFEIWP